MAAELARSADAYKVIRPLPLPFISYPYEWSFSQLKDAALLTLDIQKTAMAHGMILKDASAYNIQFCEGKPLLIDTLSFAKYVEGQPWVAYRQFCQHFLAPLALMARRDVRLNQLSRIFLDGIPLDLASRILPFGTRFKFSLLSHIHLHARSQKHYQAKPVKTSERKLSRFSFMALIDSLQSAVAGLRWQPRGTEWAEYYDHTNYSDSAIDFKLKCVDDFLKVLKPRQAWDIGANTGLFSRLASARQIPTVSLDIDPAAVEKNYLQCRRERDHFLLPLLGDITNPAPAIGWGNMERMSLLERGPADTVLALALVHHLAIGNNLPLGRIAALFATLCRALIIEFIPKDDSQVQRLLASREDIFPDYHARGFEEEFARFFSIERSEKIAQSGRILYLLKNKSMT
ncbi:MAG: SAM-dependent methyltransferase [Candidatus Aminicenantes bacterium]|nr:SAM-dependent methyltransferase [Candidatus Aminicenantes bacterium]